jgi:hypothetical protein
VEEQDFEFEELRRRKKWGDFANATSKEDIVKMQRKDCSRKQGQGEYGATTRGRVGSLGILFLRADNYDAEKVATRIANYFRNKLESFV